MKVQISFDNGLSFLPPNGVSFNLFKVPSSVSFYPLYGLFETEVSVTITGSSFDSSRPAKCRFPDMPCMTIQGQQPAPCVRDATFISDTQYRCTLPTRGAAETSTVTLQFSPDTTITDVSEMLFTTYTSSFTFHRPFSTAYLTSNSAPVDSDLYHTQVRELSIDATLQKVQKVPVENRACLDFVKIHSLNMLKVSIAVINARVDIPRIPAQIHSVIGAVGTCAQFNGYCSRDDCLPTNENPTGPNDCCLAQGMNPNTCCPVNYTSAVAAKSFCFAPNIILNPRATGDTNICPAIVRFILPRMRFCRGGPKDSTFCISIADCLYAGECTEMPVNTIVQLSTDGGQYYSGPSNSSILFYCSPVIYSWSPSRIVKDCGANCGAGAGLITDAANTLCGLQASCEKRSQVVVTIGPELIAGTCNGCDVVTIVDSSFALVYQICKRANGC